MILLSLIMFICIIIILKAIQIVPEGYEWVVEDLGRKREITLKPGLNFITPFVTRIKAKVSLLEQTLTVPPQGVITKDDITIIIDSLVFYRVTDPIGVVYSVEDIRRSICYITQVAIRDIVGKMELYDVFLSKEKINSDLRENIEVQISSWGCKVNRVEIKDIVPPKEMRDLIEEKIKARKEEERERINKIANKIAYGDQNNILKTNSQKNREWCENFKKMWEYKNTNGILSLFDKNSVYYKNSKVRLYSLIEIREEWDEILSDEFRKIEFEILSEDNNSFIVNFLVETTEIQSIILKVELNENGECKSLKKWKEMID